MTSVDQQQNTNQARITGSPKWNFDQSTKRNLYQEVISCLTSDAFIRIGEIDLFVNWGACVDILEQCLAANGEIVWADNNILYIKKNVLEEVKIVFVKKVIRELMSKNIITSKKITIQKEDIPTIFKELHILIDAAVKKHNIYVRQGEYGLVTQDDGLRMWSVTPPIQ